MRLKSLCTAYAGSPEASDKESFADLIDSVLEQRRKCLTLPCSDGRQMGSIFCRERAECCRSASPDRDRWIVSGICAQPWRDLYSKNDLAMAEVNGYLNEAWDAASSMEHSSERDEIYDAMTRLEAQAISIQRDKIPGLNLAETFDLFTAVLGEFIGVRSANDYGSANAEFWCKNCPNDSRKNCPFRSFGGNSTSCECPGGILSRPGQPIWSVSSEAQLSSRYILCSDKAKVYRAWMEALSLSSAEFDFSTEQFELLEKRFQSTCFSRKGQLGYILAIGPVLGLFACLLTIFSLCQYCATTGLPGMTLNFILLAISMTLVSFWPLSFTGSAELVSRYAYCWGHQESNVFLHTNSDTPAAPMTFTGQPCYDINSDGEHAENPFIRQLALGTGGYVTGAVLLVISLLLMIGVISKHSEAVLEAKLARPDAYVNHTPQDDPRADQL